MAKAPDYEIYKGHDMIKIYTGHVYQGNEEYISFGVRKAKAICDNIDYIRKFAERGE